MKIITVEEHFTDQRIVDSNAAYGDASGMADLPEKVKTALNGMRFTGEMLTDRDDKRLKFMDEQKVDVQVLSYTAPVSDMVPTEEALKICRQANDILAGLMEEHPDRFLAFATLPMADPEAAAKELERCAKEHHFVGALITGTWQGKFYDDPVVVRQIKRCSERHIKYCCLRSIAGESGRLFLVDSARFLLPKHHHAKYMVVQS